jgi:hypothetical protein
MNVEYFKHLGPAVTNNAMCTAEIKWRIGITKEEFKEESFYQQIGLIITKENGELLHLEHSFYVAKS